LGLWSGSRSCRTSARFGGAAPGWWTVQDPRVFNSWALVRPSPSFPSLVSGSTDHCWWPPDPKEAQVAWLAGVVGLPITPWPSSSPSAVGTSYGSSPAFAPAPSSPSPVGEESLSGAGGGALDHAINLDR